MQLKINIVDAFTGELFKGNSAAVIIHHEWLPDALMQSIAAENNLSETAFLVKQPNGSYHIRWFSPLTEVAFCGHATLAAASVIFQQEAELQELIFSAKAVGDLTVCRREGGYIEMDFPQRKPVGMEYIPHELLEGLSIMSAEVFRNQQAWFVVYDHERDVKTVKPVAESLKKLAPYDVVVTARGEKYDFVSRYFWPANGGDEDPVTGSIHAGLAPFWAERLGKNELLAYQASTRGGEILCRVAGERVFISGQTADYLQGFITVP